MKMAASWLIVHLCVFLLVGSVVSSILDGSVMLVKHQKDQKLSSKVGWRTKRQVDGNESIVQATITEMYILSEIVTRFASVKVMSTVVNTENEGQEATFTIQIPESAFISNFTMFVNGSWLVAEVKEKEAAQKEYDDAKERGETAGQVSSRPSSAGDRGMDIFQVSVNVAAESLVKFELEYNELIERRLGFITQRISVRPEQIVNNLTVRANLYEPQTFTSFDYALPGAEETFSPQPLPTSVTLVQFPGDGLRDVIYQPTVADQRAAGEKGFSGFFVVRYDVSHENGGGLVVVDDGHFVHYISPEVGLATLDKNIVFVIDISGSMGGDKIVQARQAMDTIVQQLRPQDYFNILLFDDTNTLWKPEASRATPVNIADARAYVQANVNARGGTNIHDAVIEAVDILKLLSLGGTRGKMVIFLTDGEPTSGEVTNWDQIRSNVKAQNMGAVSIFSLAFGYGIGIENLQALSWQNGGFARHIYEGVDATSQLETFYLEIESPLLVDINVVYDQAVIIANSVTKTEFPLYFKGSEIVVAAKMVVQPPVQWDVQIAGQGAGSAVSYREVVTNNNNLNVARVPWSRGFPEKVWAYMKIKDILREMAIATDKTTKDRLKEEAIQMSIQYNFVTPVTSMVITQQVDRQEGWNRMNDVSNAMGGGVNASVQASWIVSLISMNIILLWLAM